ncbi:MAG: deoxyribodipyrimidine photo-lyase, partial [Opitutales bacterium]|nr:deoxyribodipyrimidine photo-lyase [Opitutales bacterium]
MIADPTLTPSGGRALVWFRKDLRLADNPCLEAALNSGKKIIPVYIWNKEEGGAWSPGAAARWWLHQALASLGKDIQDLGGSLILKKGKAEEILPKIAENFEADTLYFGRTYDPAGRATEKAVELAFANRNSTVESFNTSLLQEPWEVKNGSGRPFQVFTPYWRKSRAGIYREPAKYSLQSLSFSKQDSSGIGLDELQLLPNHDWHLKLSEHWDVSEDA